MTFEQFLKRVMDWRIANQHGLAKEWRGGQTYMNLLYDARPDLYRKVSGTDFDAFQLDSRIPALMVWLEKNW